MNRCSDEKVVTRLINPMRCHNKVYCTLIATSCRLSVLGAHFRMHPPPLSLLPPLSLSLSLCLSHSVCLSICLFVCLSACLPAYLPSYLSVCLSVCLSLSLSLSPLPPPPLLSLSLSFSKLRDFRERSRLF